MSKDNRHKVTWDELWGMISKLPPGKCFGVSRSGTIIAGYTRNVVDLPEDADYLLDAVLESGKTREMYRKLYPDKGFQTLIDKRANPRYGWVVFPWEEIGDETINDTVEWNSEVELRTIIS